MQSRQKRNCLRANALASMIGSHFQKLDEPSLTLSWDSYVGVLEGLIKYHRTSHFVLSEPE